MDKINKTIQSLILFLVLIGLTSCIDDNPDQTISSAAKDTLSYEMLLDPRLPPCFYVVTGNGIDPNNPVYLLGTSHNLGPADYSDEVLKKIESTEILISEFPEDLTKRTKEQFSLDILKLSYGKFMEEDLHWFHEQFLALGSSPNEIKESLEFMKEERNNLQNPDFFKSWFTQLTEAEKKMIEKTSIKSGIDLLSIHPALLPPFIYLIEEPSIDSEASLEIYLLKLFFENNKEIVFLDTEKTILWASSKMFLEFLERNLDTCVQKIKETITDPKKKKGRWKFCDYSNALNINGMILEEIDPCTNARNIAWREKVLKALNSGKSASIITGFCHLKGESGFLNLLKSQGYQIKSAFISEGTQQDINKVMDFMRSIDDARLSLEPREEAL